MRLLSLLLVGAFLAFPIETEAAPFAMSKADMSPSSSIEPVAGPRCGPRAHYVRGHRNRAGHYVKGHCVRDRRPR
jgi:hypothetical protein